MYIYTYIYVYNAIYIYMWTKELDRDYIKILSSVAKFILRLLFQYLENYDGIKKAIYVKWKLKRQFWVHDVAWLIEEKPPLVSTRRIFPKNPVWTSSGLASPALSGKSTCYRLQILICYTIILESADNLPIRTIVHYIIWRFPKIGVPQTGWFTMENPYQNGWFTCTSISRNPHVIHQNIWTKVGGAHHR